MKIPFFTKEPEKKASPPAVMFADESTRGAINKATMPFWMTRPPFGIPRFKDITTLRRLGNTPQARMAKQTIIDEIVSIEWNILPKEETDEISPEMQNKLDEVTTFLLNPNTNNESLDFLLRQMLEDLLDMDSGIFVKEFDEQLRMVELRCFDGATFLKNPNQFGKYDTRADIIPIGTIILDQGTQTQIGTLPINAQTATDAALTYSGQPGISMQDAREKAAYFQYPYSSGFSFTSGVRPVAFGKKEVVWFEKNPQTNQIYGKSPIETIMEVLQTLKYSIEYNLDYFEDNNVPKGFINMPGADEDEMNSFRDRWNQLQLKTNSEGLLKKIFHRVPITNTEGTEFVKVQFSAQELQLIESQQWFSKLVFANYGVTPSELGFTEDSNLATEVNQGRVFKRKAILPLLKMIEYYFNNEIISEWDFHEEIEFKFNTFDIEDEKNKWELYKLQKDGGFKTANEIRKIEGLEELEELDNPEVPVQTLNDEELDKLNPKESNPDDSKKNAEKKAEEMDLDIIEKEMIKIIKTDTNNLLKELRNNKEGRLAQVKDFNAILNSIRGLFNFGNLKGAVDKITKILFNKGMNEVEELVNKKGISVNTISSSPSKIEFLSNMALENFQNAGTDARNKLIQQLKIGISNGEGLGKLTERVKSVVEVTKNRATAIARTETNRIENKGALHAAEQVQSDGVTIKKYLLWTDDSRTSELTKALHRKYGTEEKAIPVNSNFKLTFQGKSYDQDSPPFHINERDQLITFIVG